MEFLRSSFSRVPKHKTFNYQPRYYTETPLDEKKRFEFRRDRYFQDEEKQPLIGAFKSEPIAYRKRGSKGKGRMNLMLLLAMLATAGLTFYEEIPLLVGSFLIFCFLVIFLRQQNRTA